MYIGMAKGSNSNAAVCLLEMLYTFIMGCLVMYSCCIVHEPVINMFDMNKHSMFKFDPDSDMLIKLLLIAAVPCDQNECPLVK